MNTHLPSVAVADGISSTTSAASKSEPVTVAYAIGNTYQRLSPSEAKYDKMTGRHLKVHDWTLYIDILPGSDADIIDRVTFDMRDNSFVTTAFTCHCPIRIRHTLGSAFIGQISGVGNQNNSQQKQVGQSTSEGQKVEPSSTTRPTNTSSNCRWRFSTRQQTYGPVDVHVTIRGRGGCKCTVPYRVILEEGGHEAQSDSLPPFIEKRPHQPLKPLKMMDSIFSLEMQFALDGSIATYSSLYEVAKSIYSRSKLPIRIVYENGQSEEFAANNNKQSSSFRTPWIVRLVQPATVVSISSPPLTGGHGLNECYKIIEGLPSSCITAGSVSSSSSITSTATSLHVHIDVSTLSIQQITKVCQNFVKYEEAMDSLIPYSQREDRCVERCRSNKLAVKGDTNKQRNQHIAACGETYEELIQCMNPDKDHYYKLDLRSIHSTNKIEFRQHVSSKDKTTVTHWIRFCTAFVRNSARLRSPAALKSTTSIEEEFDLLFEYVVKDRALRNFYKQMRDTYIRQEEEERTSRLLVATANATNTLKNDESSMSISGSSSSSSEGEIK